MKYNTNKLLWGTGVDGAVTWASDIMADINATTLAITAAQTPASQVIIRATGSVTLSGLGTVTVDPGQGMSRGSFPTTHGGLGVKLGDILAALASKGIPLPMIPGGGNIDHMGELFR